MEWDINTGKGDCVATYMQRARTEWFRELLAMPLGISFIGFVFFQFLDLGAFGLVTFCVVLSELFGRSIAVQSNNPIKLASDAASQWQDAVGHVLLRWIFVCISIAIGANIGFDASFERQPILMLLVAGAILTNGLLHTIGSHQAMRSNRSFANSFRSYLCVLAIVAAAIILGETSVANLLGLYFLVKAAIFGFCVSKMPSLFGAENALKHNPTLNAEVILRNIDLIFIPFILDVVACGVYLTARAISSFAPIGLKLLDHATFTSVSTAFLQKDEAQFGGMAARVNLGYLFIGGAGGLVSIGCAQILANNLGFPPGNFETIFFWLVLSQASPAAFGATVGLMRISGMSGTVLSFQLIAALYVCANVGFEFLDNAHDLARTYAMSQLAISAALAIILGLRFGIWPGATAVMHNQIRLR